MPCRNQPPLIYGIIWSAAYLGGIEINVCM
jgi:hypothetical protein